MHKVNPRDRSGELLTSLSALPEPVDVETSKLPSSSTAMLAGSWNDADVPMRDRQFPRNFERNLFGKSLDDLDGPERQAEVIKSILAQTLAALRDMHATGIVHRDVKPENILMPSESDGKLKFIDFGAAADLRIGINYLPFRTGGTRRQRSTSCPRPPRRRPPPPSLRCFHPSCGR